MYNLNILTLKGKHTQKAAELKTLAAFLNPRISPKRHKILTLALPKNKPQIPKK